MQQDPTLSSDLSISEHKVFIEMFSHHFKITIEREYPFQLVQVDQIEKA